MTDAEKRTLHISHWTKDGELWLSPFDRMTPEETKQMWLHGSKRVKEEK